uniref:Uncharacterized protein n=1 Tax=Rhizophora mucronata TaxID=61149 RepID=A0A2P2R0F4_RHIMU
MYLSLSSECKKKMSSLQFTSYWVKYISIYPTFSYTMLCW